MHPSDMNQTLHIQDVLTDISLKVDFLFLCIYFGNLTEHIRSVLSPGYLFRVHDSYLSQKGIDVCLSLSQINIHKFMTICKL